MNRLKTVCKALDVGFTDDQTCRKNQDTIERAKQVLAALDEPETTLEWANRVQNFAHAVMTDAAAHLATAEEWQALFIRHGFGPALGVAPKTATAHTKDGEIVAVTFDGVTYERPGVAPKTEDPHTEFTPLDHKCESCAPASQPVTDEGRKRKDPLCKTCNKRFVFCECARFRAECNHGPGLGSALHGCSTHDERCAYPMLAGEDSDPKPCGQDRAFHEAGHTAHDFALGVAPKTATAHTKDGEIVAVTFDGVTYERPGVAPKTDDPQAASPKAPSREEVKFAIRNAIEEYEAEASDRCTCPSCAAVPAADAVLALFAAQGEPVVDDAMVFRACKAAWCFKYGGKTRDLVINDSVPWSVLFEAEMRAALLAALTESPSRATEKTE